ncbi:transcriptional regulator [Spirochaetia bacterium]|nr:transcriptional regulator [Spirochaetia bacterium]
MADIKEVLAANLKEYRRKRGLTQEKLAEQAEMSLHYLAMLELARKFPSGEMLERLAKALNIETHQLMEVSASPEEALERLHQSIVTDIRQVMTDMKQVVRETIQDTLADDCKGKA